jgi:hypothetical protein
MASKRISAFIAQKKLGGLVATREQLLSAYSALESSARELEPREALRVLAQGLGQLRHGNRVVHPEVVNLEVTLGDPQADVQRWLARMWEVVRQGRARANVIPLYGGTLGEWLDPGRRRHLPDEAEMGALRGLWAEPERPRPGLWERVEPRLQPERVASARALVQQLASQLLVPLNVAPARPPTELLTPAGRSDARSLPQQGSDHRPNPAWLEFEATFRLVWADLEAWDWPASGVHLQALWTGQRFRLRPQMDFVSAVVVESVGQLVTHLLRLWSGRAHLQSRLSLQAMRDQNVAESQLGAYRLAVAQHPDPLGWAPPVEHEGQEDLGAPDSIRRTRLAVQAEGAGAYTTPGGQLGRLLGLVWNEVQLATSSGRQLFVYKTDLADFFPSVSHALVQDLLEGVGVDRKLVAVILRVLSLRLADGTRTTRGLPLSLSLSQALSDLIVEVLVSEVRAVAPSVEVYALVDDLVLLSHDASALHRARNALERAVQDAGLQLNPSKTGLFALGAERPWEAPPLQWGPLELTPQGWIVADAPRQALLAASRTHVASHDALLDQVAAWRKQLHFLWAWLSPAHELGPRHMDTVREAIAALHALSLPSPDGTEHAGISALLRYELGRRFLGGGPAEIPQAWLHWPISAGGLGLRHSLADLVPLELAAETARPRKPETPYLSEHSTWEEDQAWNTWYLDRLRPLEPRLPSPSPTLDGLITRFVERGARLGQSHGALSPYWRWVLTTFGPDILDAYGSFDFVSTDLIPVALIRESLGEGRRAPRATAASDDDIPF